MSERSAIHSHDERRERLVLGRILSENDGSLVRSLVPEDFYKPSHRRIFHAIVRLAREGTAITPLSVGDALDSKDLKVVGGQHFLSNLVDSPPLPSDARRAARTVKEHRARRELAKAAQDIDVLARGDAVTRETFSIADRCLREARDSCRTTSQDAPPDLSALLDDVTAFLRRYVVFASDAQAHAVALWIVHTHSFDGCEVTPYLAVTSPEMRSGKTRLLDVLALLVARPWRLVGPSDAVVYRKIEADQPTLLLDETDAIFGPRSDYEGLRSLLNAGFQRGTKVPRCVDKGSDLQDFSVFCPKALAGIGTLPDTVADRSIPIRLARKMPSESVEKFRSKSARAEAAPLREALEALAVELPADPEVPDTLGDRAADSWEPLLAIADAAGGDWPSKARSAAVALSADRPAEDEGLPIQLLADCRSAFEDADADRLPSEKLVGALVEIPEAPWGDLRGRALTARQLASRLRKYDIRSRQVRFHDTTLKGYLRADFEDAWARYLSPREPVPARNASLDETCETQQVTALNGDTASETPQVEALQGHDAVACPVPDSESANSALTSDVSDVSDGSAFRGERADSEASAGPVPGDGSAGEASPVTEERPA